MEQSNLKPYLRNNLDILFVGLNPAKGSSDNRHYFSVNQAFWNQLYDSGLVTESFNKQNADEFVFRGNKYNYENWSYGITDLIFEVAESNSSIIRPTPYHARRLVEIIEKIKPITAVLLHGKVLETVLHYLNYYVPDANTGPLGKIIKNCDTYFFNIAFPHGNSIPSYEKVQRYIELKEYLIAIKSEETENNG